MDIILNNSNALYNIPANANYLVFEETINLPGNWNIKEEGCINIYNENNLWIEQYKKPIYYENAININDENSEISGNYDIINEGNNIKISILVPVQWLKTSNRKYPVIIDPTVNIYPTNTTYYTGTFSQTGSSPNYIYSKYNDSLYNLSTNSNFINGFMKFDLGSISSASSISNAIINYFCYTAQISNSSDGIWILTADPVTSSAKTIYTQGGGFNVWIGQWNCSSCWYNQTINVNGINYIINNKTIPGWVAYYLCPGTNCFYDFYGYSNPIYKPYLTVTYCSTPGTPTNLSTTVTSSTTANLSWIPGIQPGSPTVRYYWEVFTTGGVYVNGNNTTSTNVSATGLTCGSMYYFTVQAQTSCDNSWSAIDTCAFFTTDPCSMFVPPSVSNSYTECSGHLYDYYGPLANYGDNWDGFSVIYPGDVTKAVQLTGSYNTQIGHDFIYIYDGAGTNGTLLGTYSGTGNILTTTSSGANVPLTVRFVSDSSINYQGFDFIDTCVSICSNSPVAPISLSTNRTNFCSDDTSNISLSAIGGTGGSLLWYLSSCNSSIIGTGNPFVLASPSVTTTYYSNWYNSGCIPSSCKSVEVIVNPVPVPSLSVSTDTNNYCSNFAGNIILSVSGGSGNTLSWFTTGCGVAQIGTGNLFTITAPSVSTVYYARWDVQSCTSSQCVSIDLTVLTLPVAPLSGASNMNNFCANIGGNISLGLSGGNGTVARWFKTSCGGTLVGSGNPLSTVVPTATTKYYGRWENICGQSTCITFTVTVLSLPIAPVSLSSNMNNHCSSAGGNIVLSSSGGSGTTQYWYSGSCGTILAGSGKSITITAPTISTVYYSSWQNTCGNSACKTIDIIVNPLPIVPLSAASDTNDLCPGTGVNISLSASGGAGLTTGWYVLGCGNISVGNGNPFITAPPGATTTYWANMKSQGCVNSGCVSVTIVVQSQSTIYGNISGITSTCSGNTATYSISYSAGQTYSWTAPAGWAGTSTTDSITFITGSTSGNVTVIPSNICGSGIAVSLYVNIGLPTGADSASATPDTINQGQSTTLNVAGSLQGGEIWTWYENNCGLGNKVGTGSGFSVYPAGSTTYYVRNENGICYSNCKTVEIIINGSLNNPGTINSAPDSVCYGNSSILSVTNSLNGGQWHWYLNSCGGTAIGTGTPITVYPAINTTYFVRQENGGSFSSCGSTIVYVNSLSIPVSGITAYPDTVCQGSNTALSFNGGSLGTMSDWYWYSVSCGGIFEANGNTINPNPSINTTYFVRAEGICNTTNCTSKTIEIIDVPLQPDTITGDTDVTKGGTEQYIVTQSPGVTYTWTAPTGWAGTSATNSINYVVGSSSGFISVVPSNSCGVGIARTLDILTEYMINGYFSYKDTSATPMDSVWVYLKNNGTTIDSVQADLNGYYSFNHVQNGAYNISGKTHKMWSGVNATDAVKVKRHFAGAELFTTSLQLHAADVNMSFNINTTDAVKITRRFVGSDTSFTRGDWWFEKPVGGDTINVSVYNNDTVIVNGDNKAQNFKALCVGDVNGSNLPAPGAKPSPKIELDSHDFMRSSSNETFELPIFATNNIDIGAISMILKYPKELVTIDKCQLSIMNYELGIMNDNLIYNVIGDELRIGWFENDEALQLTKDEPVIIISGKTTGNFKPGDVIRFSISSDPLCEFADEEGNPIDNVVLKTFTIEHSVEQNIESIENALNNDMFIFPNPAENTVNMRYQIASSGKLTISLFDILGEKVVDVINKDVLKGFYSSEINILAIASGVYSIRMELNGNTIAVKKLVISR